MDSRIATASRLLVEADLAPIQGDRFQPTGFPDLGPALYTTPGGVPKLLVESPQSMANRLEQICWDPARHDVVPDLEGLPYVRIDLGEFGQTSTLLEFHRLNSPYIWQLEGDERRAQFHKELHDRLGIAMRRGKGRKAAKEEASVDDESEGEVPGLLDLRRLAQACLRFDPNSLVHGVFLEKIDGRLRLTRLLSAFIEATNVRPADYGGVKFDRVFPKASPEHGIKAEAGFANVPFARTDYVAERITAYFNIDLALLRSYGLPETAQRFLVLFALWKIRRFLDGSLRLRSACDLECRRITVTRPEGASLPSDAELTAELREALQACRREGLFAEPPVTVFRTFVRGKGAGSSAEA